MDATAGMPSSRPRYRAQAALASASPGSSSALPGPGEAHHFRSLPQPFTYAGFVAVLFSKRYMEKPPSFITRHRHVVASAAEVCFLIHSCDLCSPDLI